MVIYYFPLMFAMFYNHEMQIQSTDTKEKKL